MDTHTKNIIEELNILADTYEQQEDEYNACLLHQAIGLISSMDSQLFILNEHKRELIERLEKASIQQALSSRQETTYENE